MLYKGEPVSNYFQQDKERAIAAQNAASAAATLLAGTGAGMDVFENVRTAIFNGTIALVGGAGAQSTAEAVSNIQSSFPGAQAVTPPAPQPTQSSDTGSVVIKFGKYSGKTISQVFSEDPDYVTGFLTKSNNDFVKTKVHTFLAERGLAPAA